MGLRLVVLDPDTDQAHLHTQVRGEWEGRQCQEAWDHRLTTMDTAGDLHPHLERGAHRLRLDHTDTLLGHHLRDTCHPLHHQVDLAMDTTRHRMELLRRLLPEWFPRLLEVPGVGLLPPWET